MPDFTDRLKPAYDGTQILEAERNGSPISVEEMSKHLLSRNDWLNRQARVLAVLEKEPLLSKKNLLNLSRPVSGSSLVTTPANKRRTDIIWGWHARS